MKNLIIFGLMIVAMVLVQFAQAQTVEEIADKYAEARGGKDKLLAIKSVYMEGVRQMMGNEITVKITREQNKLSRTEFEMGAATGFMLITDKEAWSLIPMRSTEPTKMPEETMVALQSELDIAGPLVGFAQKGHKAELLGKDSESGTECFKIKLTTDKGREILCWIDTRTFLLVQTSQKNIGGGRGGNADAPAVTTYSDYKATDGILFAHTIESKAQGAGGGSTMFDKVELNKPVDPKMYKPE
jgi:hypothetical protein